MKDQAKGKGKIHVYPSIKKESKCFFCKKKGHMKKIVQNSRSSLTRKVLDFLLSIMNLIRLMLIITHGGLILVLQSMFPIPYRICKT